MKNQTAIDWLRRKKANYQTKTIAFRVRVEWIDVIKSTVKAKVAELSQNSC